MKIKKLNQTGSHAVLAVVVIVVIAAVGLVGWRVLHKRPSDNIDRAMSCPTCIKNAPDQAHAANNKTVSWSFDGKAWKANGTPPVCPNPLILDSPVNVSLATAVLYPGQIRGNDYKAHGGFRFDNNSNSDITVKVPMDAQLHNGSRYIEMGETQYFFFFIAPCGIAYRFDHLLTLSPEFQAYADKLPVAKVDDSRTTKFDQIISVKKGDIVATAVGFKNVHNVGVDFGVYDLRQPNAVSKTADWQQKHPNDYEDGAYGICWLDILPAKDAVVVKSLPGGDGASGKTSDYCK